MRLVSFNIHHGTVGKKGPVDAERLGAVCAAFEADVLCLQEVDQGTVRVRGKDVPAIIAEACGMAHVFGTSQRMLGGRYGNAIFVKGTISSTAVTRLPKVPRSRFWQEQRTLLEAEALVGDRALWVGCVHLAVKQWNNEPQLDRVLEHVRVRPAPKVILGDFNRLSNAVRPKASDAGLHVAEHGHTYPAHRPNRTIDHALLSPGIEVVATEVRSTPMSDHAALIVDIELPAP